MRNFILFLFFIIVTQSSYALKVDSLPQSKEVDDMADEIVAILQGLALANSNWTADSTYIHYGASFKTRPFSATAEAQANKDLRYLDSLGKKTIFFYTMKWMDNDQPTKKEHMEAFNKMFAKRLEEVKKAVYKKIGAVSVNVLIGLKVYVKEKGKKTADHWQWELNLDKFLLSGTLNDSCAKEIDSNLKNIVKNKSYANFKYSVNADKALQYRTKILVTLLKDCSRSKELVDIEQFKVLFPRSKPVYQDSIVYYINLFAPDFGINNCVKLIHFLAQAAHESGSFTDFEENGEFQGNRDIYRGRGIFQLTFKSGYQNFQKFCNSRGDGVDLVNNPQILMKPKYAVLSALWYWNNAPSASKNLNSYAIDLTEESLLNVSKIVNCGNVRYCGKKDGEKCYECEPNGWEDRQKKFNKLKIQIPCN